MEASLRSRVLLLRLSTPHSLLLLLSARHAAITQRDDGLHDSYVYHAATGYELVVLAGTDYVAWEAREHVAACAGGGVEFEVADSCGEYA